MEYDIVPCIITNKDLDYLSDIFDRNYLAYKSVASSIKKVNDEEIKEIFEEGMDLFHDNLISVLDILCDDNEE